MTRGRPPLPAAVLASRGSRRAGKRKHDKDLGLKTEIPTPPDHLGAEALKEWHRITPILHTAGLLTALDRAALALLCSAYGRMVEAERQLKELGDVIKSPTGFPVQNPYLAIANRSGEDYRRLCAEFGMTPSSRPRAAAGAPKVKPAPDKRDRFFNKAPTHGYPHLKLSV